MVPIKYKGFTAEVSQTSDGYTGTFQLDGSTCVFIASTLEQIMPKFVQAVEEAMKDVRKKGIKELLDFVKNHNKGNTDIKFIQYRPYEGLDYFAYLPRKEILFTVKNLQDSLPFLTVDEVNSLHTTHTLQETTVFLGEKKVFRAIPWESVIEVMSEQ